MRSERRQLGLGKEQGVSTYFSANCEEADAAICAKFLEASSNGSDRIRFGPFSGT